jgi:ferredoxin
MPAGAIVADTDTTIDVDLWRDINTRTSKKWPVITVKKEALPDADFFNGQSGKLNDLEE